MDGSSQRWGYHFGGPQFAVPLFWIGFKVEGSRFMHGSGFIGWGFFKMIVAHTANLFSDTECRGYLDFLNTCPSSSVINTPMIPCQTQYPPRPEKILF